jgi:hypothetical protein
MNTNQPTTPDNKPENQNTSEDNIRVINLKGPNIMNFDDEDDSDGSVATLVSALNSVDLNSSEAAQNSHSVSDNNGGRIELNQDKIIKK